METDPEVAVKIHPNDLRRTVRALEVFHLRDRKLSDFHREHAFQDTTYKFQLLFLVRSRAELYPRIETRVDQMVAAGLESEVKSLMDRGYRPDLPSMRGLGYQHFLNFFKGTTSREETIAFLKRDTKRYAKRQFTWFRREPSTIWVDITGLTNPSEIVAQIRKTLIFQTSWYKITETICLEPLVVCAGASRRKWMGKSQVNLQDIFLNQMRKEKIPVTMYLVNGARLTGSHQGV